MSGDLEGREFPSAPPNNSIRSITSLSVLYSRSKLDGPRGDLSTTTYDGK